MINNESENIVIQDSVDSVQITIFQRREWLNLLPNLFAVFISPCFVVFFFAWISALFTREFPGIIQFLGQLLVVSIFLYSFYSGFRNTIMYGSNKEMIVVEDHAISIEKSGFLIFKIRKVFHAEDIKGISLSYATLELLRFPKFLQYFQPKIGQLMIWRHSRLRPIFNFGKNISRDDAQIILASIFQRFPKYKLSYNPLIER